MAGPLRCTERAHHPVSRLDPSTWPTGSRSRVLPRTVTTREHENLAERDRPPSDRGLEGLGRQCGPESADILDFQVEVLARSGDP